MNGDSNREQGRPDPELLLRQVEADETRARRARLKVFLGYASGVGKTFRMIDEGRRRKQRGEDVVVGALQPDRSPEVETLLSNLEVIPEIRRGAFHMLDVDAVLRRQPEVCLVDGLAYPNSPDWPTRERWQDVDLMLHRGIAVITSLNIQHIEEKADEVARIRGYRAASTVPVSFIYKADEIAVVDAPPEYVLGRTLGRATLSDAERDAEQQLSELRELALVLAADVVDRQLDLYLRNHGIGQTYGTQERILVCLTPRADASTMIARGRRQADRFHGTLHVVYVNQKTQTQDDREATQRNLKLAGEFGAEVTVLSSDSPARAILAFARTHGITQIFVGHSRRSDWWGRVWGNPVERLILESDGIDVRVFPN
jgi:two-component system, OmpR family, sensor histidine kinase KdpD